MSQSDVDLVLRFTAAYNTGDMRALTELCADDVAGVPDSAVYPEAAPVTGREALVRLLEDSRSTWEGCVHEVREVVDVGDGRVVVRGDWAGRGTASGIDMHQTLTPVYTVREGLITRVQWFFDHEQALESVGLRA